MNRDIFIRLKPFGDKYWLVISFFLIFLLEVLVNVQTIGLSDEGYYLSTYQYFLSDLKCNEGGCMFYLTSLLGGLWEYFLGWGGILSFRLLWVFVSMLIFYYVVKILADFLEYKWWFTLSFLLLNVGYFPGVFSNKILSVLFGTMSLYYLKVYLSKEKSIALFVASVILCLNIFCRLPNIVIVLIIPVAIIMRHNGFMGGAKDLLVSIAGFVCGIGLMLMFLLGFGHLNLFVKVFVEMFVSGVDEDASHNYISMLLFYMRDVVKITFCFFLWTILYGIVRRFIKRKGFMFYPCIGLTEFALIILLNISPDRFRYSFLFIGAGIAMCFFVINKEKNMNLKSLIALSFLYVILQPIGTDYGNAVWGTLSPVVFLPVAAVVFLRNVQFESEFVKNRVRIWLILSCLIVIAVRVQYTINTGSWADPGRRYEMKYMVKESNLANIYTSKNRAKSLDELLKKCKEYVKTDDYLFCYMGIPLINYLTHTRPYLHCSSSAYYTPKSFESQLSLARSEKSMLPVVISETNVKGWKGWKQKCEMFFLFLNENRYKKVWENDSFCIYISE